MLPSMPRHRAIAFCCLLDGTRSAGRGSTDDKAKAIRALYLIFISLFRPFSCASSRMRDFIHRGNENFVNAIRKVAEIEGEISRQWNIGFFGILVCTVFYLYERKAKYAENTMHLRRRRNVCDVANRGNLCDVHLYSKVLMNTCRYRVNKCQT